MNDNVIRDSNVIGIRAVVLKLQLRHFAWPITVHHCWSLGAYTTTPQPIPALIQPFHDRLKATREWPNLALLAYSSLLLALSSEKSPFRGFILQLVFPMFIYDDLDFFFFFCFLPRGLYWIAEYCKVVLHFGSCDVTEMQRYAVIPARKRHRRTSWSLGPCDSIGGTGRVFNRAWAMRKDYQVVLDVLDRFRSLK